MKIRFADGDKVLDIETAEDMPLIVNSNEFNLGWNVDESEIEEGE
jgi:hypothetical protein